MLKRYLVPALAVLSVVSFPVAAFFTLLTIVLRTGFHCTQDLTTSVVTCLAAVIALLGATIVMVRLIHKPHGGRFVLALLAPLAALGTHVAAMNAETEAEMACRQEAAGNQTY